MTARTRKIIISMPEIKQLLYLSTAFRHDKTWNRRLGLWTDEVAVDDI